MTTILPEAASVYRHFKSLPGSDHIAKPVNLSAIIEICKKEKPTRVLELGGGIGAISYAVLAHSDAFIDIYENNDFCIGALQKNLKEFEGRFSIIPDYKTLPPARRYDFFVVDGGTSGTKDDEYKMMVHNFIRHLESLKFVYIEGRRGLQRDLVRDALRDQYIYRLIKYADAIFDGKSMSGGLKIVCYPVSSAIIRQINFLFWNTIVSVRKTYFHLLRKRR